ncbi:PspC domain-containing protein [Sphingobium nicotianae]|uniref:PspC domain-containing protein n=1 Tax=Sphingobium nicotianae TaxID=2782607 RepID=A0A9X1DEC6_9SPHN|nr:PspC domain-containing protein [Sphingobium nicotianae]MBT2188377.1 PspC domain-containing protein [Sphingobium nicotianae]
MQTYQPSIFGRSDTMLGICQAIGDDLGFHANYLRAAFAVGVFFSFWTALAVYLGVGAVVLASRLVYRSPRKPQPAPVVATAAETLETAPVIAENDQQLPLMAAA